jgi:hypothetical protein
MSAAPIRLAWAASRFPLRPRPATAPAPDRLELRLRLAGEERRVRWEGDRVRFDRIRPSGADSAVFRPSPREWDRFWRAVARLGVWQWADGFERGRATGEPTWSLELALGNRRLRTSGFDAYPPLAEGPQVTPLFASFCAAVSRLAGGRLTGDW